MNTQIGKFEIRCADDQYVLDRVSQFEEKYEMEWLEFFGRYESGEFEDVDSQRYMDFLEWSTLCGQLIEILPVIKAADTGPPRMPNFISQKPEDNSGFCFWDASV